MATTEWPESRVPSSRASAVPASPVYREKTIQQIAQMFSTFFFLDGYAIIMLETGDEKAVHYSLIVESPLVSFSYQTVTGGNISRA